MPAGWRQSSVVSSTPVAELPVVVTTKPTESLWWVGCPKECPSEWFWLGRKTRTGGEDRKQTTYVSLLRMMTEKRRTRKILRILETIDMSGRSSTWPRKTSKPLGVSHRIYMRNSWRWRGGRSQTSRNRMTGMDSCLILFVFYESRQVQGSQISPSDLRLLFQIVKQN